MIPTVATRCDPWMFWYGIKDRCCKGNIIETTDGYGQCTKCKRVFTKLEKEPEINPKDFFESWSKIIHDLKF